MPVLNVDVSSKQKSRLRNGHKVRIKKSGSLNNIPKKGPVVIVSNHPFGILDGLIMGYLLSHSRKEFKIIANRVFRKAKDLDDVILPITKLKKIRSPNTLLDLNTFRQEISFSI